LNERIKEMALASQLVYEADGELISGWEHYVDLSDQLEKFAELIIKECADWIDGQDESRCPWSRDLIRHFGVEEKNT